jgi:hypothetical protein
MAGKIIGHMEYTLKTYHKNKLRDGHILKNGHSYLGNA